MKRIGKEMMMQLTGGKSEDPTSGEKPYKVGKTWYIQCAKELTNKVNGSKYQCGKMYSGSSKTTVKNSLVAHYTYNPEHNPYEDPNTWK